MDVPHEVRSITFIPFFPLYLFALATLPYLPYFLLPEVSPHHLIHAPHLTSQPPCPNQTKPNQTKPKENFNSHPQALLHTTIKNTPSKKKKKKGKAKESRIVLNGIVSYYISAKQPSHQTIEKNKYPWLKKVCVIKLSCAASAPCKESMAAG